MRVLEVILYRLHLLGAKVVNEESSKYIASIWLYVRGQGAASLQVKKQWHNLVKSQHKKMMRDREPLHYYHTLPSTPAQYRSQFPDMFNVAYASDLPIQPHPDVENGVMVVNGSFRSRGNSSQHLPPQGLFGDEAIANPMHQCLSLLAGMAARFNSQASQRSDNDVDIKLLTQPQPSGRPMRCLQNVKADPARNIRQGVALQLLHRRSASDDGSVPSALGSPKPAGEEEVQGAQKDEVGGSIVPSREVEEEVKGNRLPSLEETLAKLSTRPKNKKPQKEVHLEIMPTKKVPNTPPPKRVPPRASGSAQKRSLPAAAKSERKRPCLMWDKRLPCQILGRNGFARAGNSKPFRWEQGDTKGEKRARAEGERWLAEQMAEWKGD